jgi:hypothetical protein
MIGNFNLPIAKNNAKTYIFSPVNLGANGAGIEISMQKWEKPKGINFVYGLLIGAGSGGGGGFSMGVGTTGGGGGGGTPGGTLQFLQPAYLVPDILYIQVSTGGAGGAAGANGAFGNLITGLYYSPMSVLVNSTVRVYYALPNTVQSGTQSGRSGSAAAGGAGGTAVSVSTTLNQPGIMGFSNYAIPAALSGFAGTLVAGTDATFAGRPTGGAGGGGVTTGTAFAGGNVLAPTTSVNSIWSRNLSGGTNNGSTGENGITLFKPTFFSLPGAGGGASASGTGGNGGKGGIGCGGGGGGAGVTGGTGGAGGDGLVMLVCW